MKNNTYDEKIELATKRYGLISTREEYAMVRLQTIYLVLEFFNYLKKNHNKYEVQNVSDHYSSDRNLYVSIDELMKNYQIIKDLVFAKIKLGFTTSKKRKKEYLEEDEYRNLVLSTSKNIWTIYSIFDDVLLEFNLTDTFTPARCYISVHTLDFITKSFAITFEPFINEQPDIEKEIEQHVKFMHRLMAVSIRQVISQFI